MYAPPLDEGVWAALADEPADDAAGGTPVAGSVFGAPGERAAAAERAPLLTGAVHVPYTEAVRYARVVS